MKQISFVLLGFFSAASLIYATPLRYFSVVEPSIHDWNAADFHQEFSNNADDFIFIDVRPADVYERLHAKGSISMPLHTLYTERKTLPKSGKTIVLICSGGAASGVGYHYLEHFGFTNIARIQGGIEEWVKLHLPVEGDHIPAE